MTHRLPDDERILDLICERALRGLDDTEQGELDAAALDTELPGEFDRAVGALYAALAPDPPEPMPDSIRRSLEETARQFEAEQRSATEPKLRLTEAPTPPQARSAFPATLGWFAAAACLALAAVAWWPSSPAAEPTLAEQYAQLADAPGVVKTTWVGLDDLGLSPTPHQYDDQLAGEIVWDASTQTGFMKFTGLATNNPREMQYQLWMFDAARPAGDLPQFAIDGFPDLLTQRPVDGGVFDIAAVPGDSGTVIIPIDAKLRVDQAAIFAITVEPPGGVVVSDRDIVTVAVAG
ncbi:MAG: hypothetical protein DHS20C14_19410 [Phycisphaeraceae bacterium]|nr:MAG: hypothetical protein DHS20C14_19410 [Phycisphaeraceae bacterium]